MVLFVDIFNSFEDIFNSFEDIFKYNTSNDIFKWIKDSQKSSIFQHRDVLNAVLTYIQLFKDIFKYLKISSNELTISYLQII